METHRDTQEEQHSQLPLSIEVDCAANSITSELILEGKYMNKEIDVLTSKLLEHCKKEHDSIELALQSQGPDDPASDKGKELRTRQDALTQAQIAMINYALKNKHSCERWTNIVNVIMLKEPGNNKIH
eukprot:15328670-Ditylum_brightwellii.AAC.1